MEKDFSEFNNHTVLEANLIPTESSDPLMDFVKEYFYIKKEGQSFEVIDQKEGIMMILSYKNGEIVQERSEKCDHTPKNGLVSLI